MNSVANRAVHFSGTGYSLQGQLLARRAVSAAMVWTKSVLVVPVRHEKANLEIERRPQPRQSHADDGRSRRMKALLN